VAAFLISQSQKETPLCARATLLRQRGGTAQSASTPGDLNAIRKRQGCHKLATGSCSITSLTGKEHELSEEGERYSRMLLAFLPLSVVVLEMLSWATGRNSATSVLAGWK